MNRELLIDVAVEDVALRRARFLLNHPSRIGRPPSLNAIMRSVLKGWLANEGPGEKKLASIRRQFRKLTVNASLASTR